MIFTKTADKEDTKHTHSIFNKVSDALQSYCKINPEVSGNIVISSIVRMTVVLAMTMGLDKAQLLAFVEEVYNFEDNIPSKETDSPTILN